MTSFYLEIILIIIILIRDFIIQVQKFIWLVSSHSSFHVFLKIFIYLSLFFYFNFINAFSSWNSIRIGWQWCLVFFGITPKTQLSKMGRRSNVKVVIIKWTNYSNTISSLFSSLKIINDSFCMFVLSCHDLERIFEVFEIDYYNFWYCHAWDFHV